MHLLDCIWIGLCTICWWRPKLGIGLCCKQLNGTFLFVNIYIPFLLFCSLYTDSRCIIIFSQKIKHKTSTYMKTWKYYSKTFYISLEWSELFFCCCFRYCIIFGIIKDLLLLLWGKLIHLKGNAIRNLDRMG